MQYQNSGPYHIYCSVECCRETRFFFAALLFFYRFPLPKKKASTAGMLIPWKVVSVMVSHEPVTECYLNPGIVVQPRFESNEPNTRCTRGRKRNVGAAYRRVFWWYASCVAVNFNTYWFFFNNIAGGRLGPCRTRDSWLYWYRKGGAIRC